MKVSTKDGVTQVEQDYPDPSMGSVLLMDVLGTRNVDFLDGILGQLINAGTAYRIPQKSASTSFRGVRQIQGRTVCELNMRISCGKIADIG